MTTFVQELFDPVSRTARRLSEISRTVINVGRPVPRVDVAAPDGSETDNSSLTGMSTTFGPSRPPSSPNTVDTRTDDPPTELAQDDGGPALPRFAHVVISPHRRRVGPIPEDDGMGATRKRLQLIQHMEASAEDKARFMHEVMMEPWASKAKATPETASAPLSASVPKSASASASTSAPTSASSPSSSTEKEEAWEETLSLGALDSLKIWPSNTEPEKFTLTAEDVRPTYSSIDPYPPREPFSGRRSRAASDNAPKRLGCAHYLRNVKLQCSTCAKWYTCRFCHDAAEDHALVRKETKNMLCMLCGSPQRASETCVRCKATAAQYYCNVCKLWDDHPNKPIYHCDDCGICRRGAGLGKDFFHCKKCCACISVSIEGSHRCIERSTDCDCPICGDYLFTSPRPVVFMNCGHSIHDSCYDDHIRSSYKCPICNKSLVNMDAQFRNLDAAIEQQPMPPDWRNARSTILCNDCSAHSTVPYHFIGLKCAVCMSYNTVELQMLGPVGHVVSTAVTERFIVEAEATLARLGAAADHGARTREAGSTVRQREHEHEHEPRQEHEREPEVEQAPGRRIEDGSNGRIGSNGVSSARNLENHGNEIINESDREWLRDHTLYVRGLEETLRREGVDTQLYGDNNGNDDDDDDDDDDILRLWRSSSSGSNGTDDDEDEETDIDEAEDEDDDEEDDYMVLIGHR